jgi:uncharacterized membrane protein
MYKIIGGDGNEYGPVTTEQLQQWIAEGRANTQTKARREGEMEWKPLAGFPEFASALVEQTRARLAEPPATPAAFPTGGAKASGPATLADGDYELDLGGSISRGWALLKGNFGPLFGGFMVYMLVVVVVGLLSGIPFVGPVFSLANLVITGPLMGGLYYLYLNAVRGEAAEVGDVFAGFRKGFAQLFLGYIVPGLLSGLCMIPVVVIAVITLLPSLKQHNIQNFHPETAQLVLIGVVAFLCVIPMIFLQMSWVFTLPLIIDRNMDFWTAMKTSWKRVNLHWWQVFGLVLLIGLVNVVGVLLCCVGVLVTMPIGFAALMYAYETIFSGADPRSA